MVETTNIAVLDNPSRDLMTKKSILKKPTQVPCSNVSHDGFQSVSKDSYSAASTHSWVLPITALIVLITGTANMLLISMLNRTKTPKCKAPECEESLVLFEAPFTQQLVNGVGQMACLLVYYIDNWISTCRKDGRRVLDYEHGSFVSLPEPSPYLWVFPAILDFGASMMLLYALVLETASSVQILRTFSVILCAILSVTYLHRDLRVFHWLGISLMTVGLLLTGWDSIYSSTLEFEEVDAGTRWLGVGFILMSTGLTVFQLVFEERLVSNYRCSPFQGVGWIGIWETVIVLFAALCAHISGYERIDVVWWQISQEPRLQTGIACFGLSTAVFTACSLAVTKMHSGLLTSVATAMRQVPIWALELAFHWTLFGWAGFFGMLLTCGGFLVYNCVLPTRYCAGYERFAMKEVRIRCSCHDEDDEDLEEDLEEEDETTTRFESSAPFATQEDNATTTGSSVVRPPPKSTDDSDDLHWKRAIITTKKGPPAHADSDSAWIYVRRSEEWISTSDPRAKG